MPKGRRANHWKSVQFFFHCTGKSLSPVEMFGEISGDCRQMGIYLVSHISILPSQPSPPSLYFVNNTVHKEGKEKRNISFYFSSTKLNSKCRLQTMYCMPFSTTYFFVNDFLAAFSNELVPLSKPKLLASLQLIKSEFCDNPRTRPCASQ